MERFSRIDHMNEAFDQAEASPGCPIVIPAADLLTVSDHRCLILQRFLCPTHLTSSRMKAIRRLDVRFSKHKIADRLGSGERNLEVRATVRSVLEVNM